MHQDRYNNYQSNQTYYVQTTTKHLTFGNVKNNGTKIKEVSNFQDQSTLSNLAEVKRPLQIAKNPNAVDKVKSNNITERSEKPLVDRVNEKREKVAVKAPIISKSPKQIVQNMQIDDFTCS